MPKMTGAPSIHSDARKKAQSEVDRLHKKMNELYDEAEKLEGSSRPGDKRIVASLTRRATLINEQIQGNPILYP